MTTSLHGKLLDMEEGVRSAVGLSTALCTLVGSMIEGPAQQAAYAVAGAMQQAAMRLEDEWKEACRMAGDER